MASDWVEIISFTYPHEANLAKSFLEAFNIKVIIKDELTIQVYNFLSNAIGGVKIFVEKSNVEEALLLLEDAGYILPKRFDKKEKIEIFSSEDKNICPYCGKTNTIKKSIPGYIFVLSILLLSFPLPFLKKVYYCYDCSKEWKIKS